MGVQEGGTDRGYRKVDPGEGVQEGMDGLEKQYAAALEVILREEGALKDDTYMLHLVTETGRRLRTDLELERCGIIAYVRTVLRERLTCPALVTCALQFARLCLVPAAVPEVVNLLEDRMQQLCSADDQAVTAALLELVAAALRGPFPASPPLLPLCLHRAIASLLLRSLAAPPSYHIGDLATQCLSLLLELLTPPVDVGGNVSGTVNYRKLRHNLLVEYFDTVTDKRTLLGQLKRMLKNAQKSEVRQLLVDFIAAKVDMTFLPVAPVDFCCVVLEITGWEEEKKEKEGQKYGKEDGKEDGKEERANDLFKKLVRVQDPALKLILVFEMCKRLEQRPNLADLIIEYVEAEQSTPQLIKLLAKPNFARHISSCPQLLTSLLSTCSRLLQRNPDLSDPIEVRTVGSILGFLRDNSVLAPLPDPVLDYVTRQLSSYLGPPDVIKTACCDLLTSALRSENGGMSEERLGELGPALGYCAVNTAGSWQLRDSAIQCLTALLLASRSPAPMPPYPASISAGPAPLAISPATLPALISSVSLSCSRDSNSYVRSASYSLLSALVSALRLTEEQEAELCSRAETALLNDQEALVRREAVDFLVVWAASVSRTNLTNFARIQVRVLLTDFDWEVKLKTAGFWLKLLDRSASELDRSASEKESSVSEQDRRRFLGDHWFYTALQAGLEDYEGSVAAAYTRVQERMEQELGDGGDQGAAKIQKLDCEDGGTSLSKRQGKEGRQGGGDFYEDDVDEVIEDIVTAEDTDLLANLRIEDRRGGEAARADDGGEGGSEYPRRSADDYRRYLRQRGRAAVVTEPDPLQSILEDIINSAGGRGMVELVDCY